MRESIHLAELEIKEFYSKREVEGLLLGLRVELINVFRNIEQLSREDGIVHRNFKGRWNEKASKMSSDIGCKILDEQKLIYDFLENTMKKLRKANDED